MGDRRRRMPRSYNCICFSGPKRSNTSWRSDSYEHINVEAQRRDPNSLLNWTASLIRLRKECPEIGFGEWELLETGFDSILGMRYTWKGRSLFIWHNFSESSREIVFTAKKAGTERLVDLMNNIESEANAKGRHTITLEAYGYRWFRDKGIR